MPPKKSAKRQRPKVHGQEEDAQEARPSKKHVREGPTKKGLAKTPARKKKQSALVKTPTLPEAEENLVSTPLFSRGEAQHVLAYDGTHFKFISQIV